MLFSLILFKDTFQVLEKSILGLQNCEEEVFKKIYTSRGRERIDSDTFSKVSVPPKGRSGPGI